ncbi:unnamed protein product [Urochloa humidicola]
MAEEEALQAEPFPDLFEALQADPFPHLFNVFSPGQTQTWHIPRLPFDIRNPVAQLTVSRDLCLRRDYSKGSVLIGDQLIPVTLMLNPFFEMDALHCGRVIRWHCTRGLGHRMFFNDFIAEGKVPAFLEHVRMGILSEHSTG